MSKYKVSILDDSVAESRLGLLSWGEDLPSGILSEVYTDHSVKEMDKKFARDLKVLVKSLSKLSDPERKIFIKVMATIVQSYLEQKVDKELDISIKKVFKFKI
jgi:hypothetical protein